MTSIDYSDSDILIVDDNKSITYVLERFMDLEGYSTETAKSGEEALYLIRVLKKKYRLMLLDINMPGGMHGVDLCLEIRKHDEETPIYAISGLQSLFVLADVQAAGFSGYLEKPILREHLAELIKKELKGD